jgi:TatD DNase family protein
MINTNFSGFYNKIKKHGSDFHKVVKRARGFGVSGILIASRDINDSLVAMHASLTEQNLYTTIGVHPTRCEDPYKEADVPAEELNDHDKQRCVDMYFKLIDVALEEDQKSSKVILAIGECGLYYT